MAWLLIAFLIQNVIRAKCSIATSHVFVPCFHPSRPCRLQRQSAWLISKAAPLPRILYPSTSPSSPRSLVLIRHVHIRGRGDAFMIIHPPYQPLIMAALDAQPIRTRHLASALFSPTFCITTLFNGLFKGEGPVEERVGGRPRVSSRRGSSKEPQWRSSTIVIDGTMFKWRMEEAESGGHYLLLYAHYVQPGHSAGCLIANRLGSGAQHECVLTRPRQGVNSFLCYQISVKTVEISSSK